MIVLIINIVACWMIAFGSFKAFQWSQEFGTKFSLVMNYLLFITSIFMSFYLINEFSHILAQPINERLNNYETFSKVVFALFLISFTRKKR